MWPQHVCYYDLLLMRLLTVSKQKTLFASGGIAVLRFCNGQRGVTDIHCSTVSTPNWSNGGWPTSTCSVGQYNRNIIPFLSVTFACHWEYCEVSAHISTIYSRGLQQVARHQLKRVKENVNKSHNIAQKGIKAVKISMKLNSTSCPVLHNDPSPFLATTVEIGSQTHFFLPTNLNDT